LSMDSTGATATLVVAIALMPFVTACTAPHRRTLVLTAEATTSEHRQAVRQSHSSAQ
jgi:hypothetical protein